MYYNVKNVINNKQYELSDMLRKIDILWLQSELTDEQKQELIALARENAIPENSYAGLQEQVDKLFEITSVHEKEILKLKGQEPKPQPEEYPEYVQPTGSHDAYYKDDKMTFEGGKYICIAPEGVAVVWNPTAYPAYWKLVE